MQERKALEERQLEMAKVQKKLKQQILHLDYLYNTLNNTKIHLETLLEKGAEIDFIIIKSHQDYIQKLHSDIKNQHKIIADTEIELDEKKKEVVEALKAKTILEKLKEKDYKEFIKNFERLDLIQIDEISTNRHSRCS